jgi:uncharacterized membrane protein (DUF2068 family)
MPHALFGLISYTFSHRLVITRDVISGQYDRRPSMGQTLVSAPRRHGMTIVSLLLTLQAITLWILAVFVFGVVMHTALSAAGHHKPTAASLITAVAVGAGGSFFLVGLLVLLLAWGPWRQKNWAFWCRTILEGLFLLISLVGVFGGMTWVTISEGVLATAILVVLFVERQARAVSRL